MQDNLSDAATRGTYRPHAGPITLDTLDELFASRRAAFGGFSMKEGGDEDGDGEENFEVDGDGDEDGDGEDGDGEDGDGEEGGDGDADKGAKAALSRERKRVKELRRQLAEAREAGKKKDEDADGDDAEKKAEAKWKPRLVNSAAKTALLTAGADKPERLLKLLDTDALDVDEDGEVDGLDDEVDRLKEEYPELFSTTKRANRKVETGDRSGKGGASKKLSATEKQAKLLTGGK